ncbi:Homocysteine S-methyltransferase [Haematococcus lacustris]
MDANPLVQLLAHQPCIILDGAMGTELEARGIVINGSRLWSSQLLLDNPDVLREIHLAYLRAGADVVTTATYQASVEGFVAAGVAAEAVPGLLQLAVRLADEARQQAWQEQQQQQGVGNEAAPGIGGTGRRQRPLLGLSCGSYGACLCDGSEFSGAFLPTVTRQQLADWHSLRVRVAAACPQVDLLCFETIPALEEAAAVVQVLQQLQSGQLEPLPPPQGPQARSAPEAPAEGGAGGQAAAGGALRPVPAWVSLSCRDAALTCAGDSWADQVVPLLWGCDLVAGIGVNCTSPAAVPGLMDAAAKKLALLEQLRAEGVTSRLAELHGAELAAAAASRTAPAPVLLVYPNSGEAFDGEKRCWVDAAGNAAEAQTFAEQARVWVQAGARAVGGCCRTGPDHIRHLRATLLAP